MSDEQEDTDVRSAVNTHAFSMAYTSFGAGRHGGVGRHRDLLATKLRQELPAVIGKLKSDVVNELGEPRR